MITHTGVRMPRLLAMALIIAASFLLSLFSLPSDASAASIYGRGTYGECKYQRDCPTPPGPVTPVIPPTVTTTPSGLEVAINLTNDQVLPRDGYLVKLTPLNGEGRTFEKALIYIDDKYVTTVYPGSNGTGEWFWDTQLYPGTNIRFVITDNTGRDSTQTFRVRIAREGEPTGAPLSPTQTPRQDNQTPFGAIFTQVGDSLENFIMVLPKEVIYAFPWIIFILIAMQITILIIHTRREATAIHKAESIVSRARDLGNLKDDFMNLLAHHLRTPLTTLQGGLDLQSSETGDESTASLRAVTDEVRATVETIITEAKQTISSTPFVNPKQLNFKAYLPFLMLLIGAGVFAFGFLFLANTVSAISTSRIDFLVQALVYILLCSFALIFLRILKLRQAERNQSEAVLDQEKILQSARDGAIEKINQRLRQHVEKLEKLVVTLPPDGIGAEFVKPALANLSKLADKCYIASQLSDSTSQQTSSLYPFDTLYSPVSEHLVPVASEKNITLATQGAGTVLTPKPELVSVVLKSLLENAIAYSPVNSTVSTIISDSSEQSEITVRDNGEGMTKDQISQLFQPFYKAEGSETYDHEGMGFSLYLDKLIMTYLGGQITASSQPGTRTDFTITIPKKTTDA